MVGSSLIKRLDNFLKRRNEPLPPTVRLKGQSGLTLQGLRKLLEESLSRDGEGNIVLHVGANDIGNLTEKNWILELEIHLRFLKMRYPKYKIFWSDMTPRSNWRGKIVGKMETKRKRSNIRARKLFFKLGDGVVHHPELQENASLLHSDGIHFNNDGQISFWNDFKSFFLL